MLLIKGNRGSFWLSPLRMFGILIYINTSDKGGKDITTQALFNHPHLAETKRIITGYRKNFLDALKRGIELLYWYSLTG